MFTQIEQTVNTDSSYVSTFKPEIDKEQVLDLIPSENYVQKDVVIDQEEEEKKEMVKEVISGGFHVDSLITTGDDTSSVRLVEMKKKEDVEEPISQLENCVKKNQEFKPVGNGGTELYDSFIIEEKKETQEEISSKDSAKEEVCLVHSTPTSKSQFENVVVKMNSESSCSICIIDQEEDKKEMVKETISGGFHGNSVITTNDDTSSVIMVEMKKKEDSEEPVSQIENGVKKNQECEEPVGKDSTELCGSFIAEQMKETQEEMSSEDVIIESSVKDSSAKEEVCLVHSLPPSMSRYENVLVNMNSESSSSRIEGKQEEVFQVQDVITGDEHIILVVERTQDGFVETKSISPSQNLAEMSNWGHFLDKKTTNQEIMIGSGDTNWWGKWGEFSASGSRSSSNGIAAEIGSTRIVDGNGFARKELMGSVSLGKRRSGICSANIRQRGEKCSRRNFTETNWKKKVLSMFAEARNVFCQKKSDGIKQSYLREEMEALRFENSYQQRQIWREIYTGLGPVVATELNFLAEARQNGNAITNQQQQQHHHQPQLHRQHPRQHQQYPLQSLQHHQYPQQQQQHHQHPKKPLQHHHHHNHHQHQQAGVNKENASILGAATAMGRPIHLRINMKNARAN